MDFGRIKKISRKCFRATPGKYSVHNKMQKIEDRQRAI